MGKDNPEQKEMATRMAEATKEAIETATMLRVYYLAYRRVGFGRLTSLLLILVYDYALASVRANRPIIFVDSMKVSDKPLVN